jgi:hypothetical protein
LVLHPEDHSSLPSTGLHSANSVLGDIDREGTTSSKLAAITAHYPDACLIVEALLTEMIGVPVKEHCTRGQSPSRCFEVLKSTVAAVPPRATGSAPRQLRASPA